MRVAFDIDGVVADLQSALVREAEMLFGRTLTITPEVDQDHPLDGLTARGESLAAVDRRCIPSPPQRGCRVGDPGSGCVAPPSNTADPVGQEQYVLGEPGLFHFRNIDDGPESRRNRLVLRAFQFTELRELYLNTLLECADSILQAPVGAPASGVGWLEPEVTRGRPDSRGQLRRSVARRLYERGLGRV